MRRSLLFPLVLLVSGCATRIPTTDIIPPEVELVISGPGIGRVVMSNPPMEEWVGDGGDVDFRSGTSYRFTVTVNDKGGVRGAGAQFPSDLTVGSLTPADARVETAGLSTVVSVNGDPADPRTLLSVSGTVTFPSRPFGSTFDFDGYGFDYGGTSGLSNETRVTAVSTLDRPDR